MNNYFNKLVNLFSINLHYPSGGGDDSDYQFGPQLQKISRKHRNIHCIFPIPIEEKMNSLHALMFQNALNFTMPDSMSQKRRKLEKRYVDVEFNCT